MTVWLILTSAATTPQVFAQKEPGKEQKAKDPDNLDFWLTRHNQHVGAAAEMVLAQNPFTTVVLRFEAQRWTVWDEPEADTAPPLDPLNQWTLLIRDKTPMPDLRGKAPDEISKSQRAARDAWVQAMINASLTSVDAFKKSAEDNLHVTFAQLYNDPPMYRFKVIKLEGRMARLRKFDSVPGAALDAGITHYYEGYVYGPTAKSNPFFVQFLTLPEGLKEAEKMDRWVTFYGYFFKLTRYKDGQKKDQDTPLLIGPAVILGKAPAADDSDRSPLSEQFVFGLVGFGVFMIVLLTGLSWWFRRGDRQFRDRVADIHAKSAEEAMESAEHGLPSAPDLPNEEHLRPDQGGLSQNGRGPKPPEEPGGY